MKKRPAAGSLYDRQQTTEGHADELTRRTGGLFERLPVGIVPSNQRLVRIENSSPTAGATVFNFSYIDATYTATAGVQALTVTDRESDGVVYNLAGQQIPDQTVLMAWMYPRDPRWYTWYGAAQTCWQGWLSAEPYQQVTSSGEALQINSQTEAVAGFTLSGASDYKLTVPAGRYLVSYSGGCYNPTSSGTRYDVHGRVMMQKYNGSGWDDVPFGWRYLSCLVCDNVLPSSVIESEYTSFSNVMPLTVPASNPIYRLWVLNEDHGITDVQPMAFHGTDDITGSTALACNWVWLRLQ